MARRVEKYREMNAGELEIQQRELSEQVFRLRFRNRRAAGSYTLRMAVADSPDPASILIRGLTKSFK